MNIIEAIKSGKPFTRAGFKQNHFLCVKGGDFFHLSVNGGTKTYSNHQFMDGNLFDVEDILANDWEVKEP